MTRVLDEAVHALERRAFFDLPNSRYAELLQDAEVGAEIEAERGVENGAPGDASK
ncbi:MAG: hypothetical protein ABIJ48_11085 [Actinomycetota bacterium]